MKIINTAFGEIDTTSTEVPFGIIASLFNTAASRRHWTVDFHDGRFLVFRLESSGEDAFSFQLMLDETSSLQSLAVRAINYCDAFYRYATAASEMWCEDVYRDGGEENDRLRLPLEASNEAVKVADRLAELRYELLDYANP